MFKKKVCIKELPPIGKKSKMETNVIENEAQHNTLDLLFGNV
jgi:hypothetical protein